METTALTPVTATRRKASKARRDLQTTIGQIDALFPALADKPTKQADLLCEKAASIKTLLSLESEDQDTEQAERIKELEQQLSVSAAKITELEQQNRKLQVTASTREIVNVPDPNHAAVKEERDAWQSIVALLAATLAEDARAEAAVRVSMTCSNPRVVEEFARLTGIDYGALIDYATYTESGIAASGARERLQSGFGSCISRGEISRARETSSTRRGVHPRHAVGR